jgi:hypothetical protein
MARAKIVTLMAAAADQCFLLHRSTICAPKVAILGMLPSHNVMRSFLAFERSLVLTRFYAAVAALVNALSGIFNSIPGIGPGYSGLTGPALKPVILTEYGLPATGHRNANDPSTIYEDGATRAATAEVVGPIMPKAFQAPICRALYYFAFCDEWWNQPGSPNIYTWWGGTPVAAFPNGYWDQDGFGLYSIARGGGLPNNAPIWVGNGPNPTIDIHTGRTELTAVLNRRSPQLSSARAGLGLPAVQRLVRAHCRQSAALVRSGRNPPGASLAPAPQSDRRSGRCSVSRPGRGGQAAHPR